MVAGDQVGIGGFNSINSSNKDVATLGGYGLMKGIQRKTHYDKDGRLIKRTTESSIDSMYMNDSDFQKKYKINKQQFNNLQSKGVGDDTKVASSMSAGSGGGYYVDAGERRGFVSTEQAERMLANPEAYKMRPSEIRYLRQSMPFTEKVDASGTINIDGKTFEKRRGAGYGGGVEVDSGIKTPAPETKVDETKRMAGDFFSPQNFQRSGVPDATIMTGEQVRQSLTGDPGYTRFGSLDRPGTQAAKDTAAFNQRVKSDFFSPVKADARSIAERREASVQSMRDEARERDTQFRTTGQQTFGGRVTERRSGDDTYGTNVMSNPAFGFRSKMSAENQKRYDASATEATRRAEVEPSKGNLIQSTVNIGKRLFNTAIGASEGTPLTREVALEKRGEAEQRRYEKYLNRPMYQREATARVEAGITNQDTIDKNREQVRADAAARNAAFQASKRADRVERVARRTPENTGTGRDGTFGEGTVGKGMPSNPDFRGPGNNKAFERRQTVAALPSDYKQTEAREFAKAAAFKEQQKAKEAAVNKASREGAAATGIPSGSNLKAGSFGISDAGRKQAAQNRQAAQKKSAPSTQKSAPSAPKAAPSPSSNKRADAAKKRRAAQSKAAAAKKTSPKTTKKKSTTKKSSPSSQASNKRAQASKKRQAAKKKASTAKKKSAPKKKSISRPRRRTRRGGRRCDIRCKYNIMPLTNMNLIRDDLAEVAYFVKELQA